MYVFVDESGNTGHNLFDDAQPIFTTLALLTRSDFDKLHARKVAQIAAQLGVVELHAGELGVDRIETIAPGLLAVLKAADARFALSRVEKKYLLASKIFDSIFDSGENMGAAWHVYNIRPLRLILMLKLAAILPEHLAREFWEAMMAKSQKVASAGLVKFCDDVLALLPGSADRGLVERVSQAMTWARDNPEAIYFHSSGKQARHGHLPNTVGFGNLLDGIELWSKRLRRPVKLIRHDEQSQFEGVLKFWHDMFANASPEAVELMMGEKFVMQRGYGSKLQMSSSEDSAGIQVTDVLLWLFNRLSARKEIGSHSWKLMQWVFRHAHQIDFSFDTVSRALDDQFGWMMTADMTQEQLDGAKDLLRASEEGRQRRMLEYAETKQALQVE